MTYSQEAYGRKGGSIREKQNCIPFLEECLKIYVVKKHTLPVKKQINPGDAIYSLVTIVSNTVLHI